MSQRFREDADRTVRIPVQVLSNGTVAMESGARLPRIRPGALGELVMQADSVDNPAIVEALNGSASTTLLSKGELVWVRLVSKDASTPGLVRFEDDVPHPRMIGHQFAPVTLEEDVRLVTRGTKRGQLEKALCLVRVGQGRQSSAATSLNHAYRLLSEAFESHRVSFGGNIFEAAFVRRQTGWISLDALRTAAEAAAREEVDRAVEAIERQAEVRAGTGS